MKNDSELIASMSENVVALKAKNKELEEDGIAQRLLIERLTRIIKNWSRSIDDELWNQCADEINEYERRFTGVSDKHKPRHPVFTKREVEED